MGAAPDGMPSVSPSAGRYLEAAYYLLHEGEVVRPGRLAEWLGVSAPTVTQAVARLVRDGLVEAGRGRDIRFTPAGRRAAEEIVRRHRVAEVWLNKVLGFDWVVADEEAQHLAHALSDRVLDRLHDVLGQPPTCPHGNPIPGARQSPRRLTNLTALQPGQRARIGRISEVAEHEAPELLVRLYDAGMVPGTRVAVEPGDDVGDDVAVTVRGQLRRLPRWAARAVWVEVTEPEA